MQSDEQYMEEALLEAACAAELGEVPVGAVIVRGGEIIARAHNLREHAGMATAHAELLAVEQACRMVGGWRLTDCTLYVTLEPCPMCAGTLINARVGRVVFGAKDARAGAMGSILQINAYPFNHKIKITSGVLGARCATLLRDFFADKR